MIDETLYRKKVLGCWLGKAVGGTLGAPVEGWGGPHHFEFYDPVPQTMVPNDDLDLQVVWACALDRMETPELSADLLGQAWLDHVGFPWDEYGVAIRNLRNGIRPPFSGSYDNYFTDGMGAAIRSEIWACLAPGDPELAARYAWQDACVDHADSGLWAEVFLAAMESAAFAENDMAKILDAGLKVLPEDSPLRKALDGVCRQFELTPDFDSLFEYIMKHHKGDNFTDVKLNMPIIAAALLLGNGDFDKSICFAVNFGEDSDCTGATVGALLGILDPECIGERWLAPIGRDLVLSPPIRGVNPPATLDEFSDMICNLRKRMKLNEKTVENFTPVPVAARAAVSVYGKPVPELEKVIFNGAWAHWERPLLPQEVLTLKFPFQVPADGEYVVMFNTKSEVEVFVDDDFAFHREPNGSVVPSFHRAPWNQCSTHTLKAGKHLLKATLRNYTGKTPEWIAGIGYGSDKQWVPDAFERA